MMTERETPELQSPLHVYLASFPTSKSQAFSDVTTEQYTPAILSPSTGKKIVHFLRTNKLKKSWGLNAQRGTKTVVIADSNLRNTSSIPTDWEVHVYPGIAFKHATEILTAFKLPTAVKNIVVVVGINQRSLSFIKTTTPAMSGLKKCLENHSTKTCLVSGISIGTNLMPDEAGNIWSINKKKLN